MSSSPFNYLAKVFLFVAASYTTRIAVLAKLLVGGYRQKNKECTWVIQMSEQSRKEMKTAVKVNVRLFKDSVNYWFFRGDYLFKRWQAYLRVQTRQPKWMGERGRASELGRQRFSQRAKQILFEAFWIKEVAYFFHRVHPSTHLRTVPFPRNEGQRNPDEQ